MSVQKLKVAIAQKGLGETGSFVGSYTMREHYEDKRAQNDGHDFAKSKMGLESDYIVSVGPCPDSALEAAVAHYLEVDTLKVVDQVINPLHTCFRNYELVELLGKIVAISTPFSIGYRYGVVDSSWVEEAGTYSSITLPQAA